MIDLATEEMKEALELTETAQHKAVLELVPVSELDEKECILEIKSAAGGSESALFAEDLKNMYESY